MTDLVLQPLSIAEQSRLAELESIIAAGLQTFVAVGLAIAEIRDSRLYRQTHSTLEDYCRERWQIERRHAYRLIDAAQVVGNVSNWTQIDPPATESQARPLTVLEPEQQREVWQRAVETAPNGKVTAAHVQATVNGYRYESAIQIEPMEPVHALPLTAANHAPSADPDYDGDEWYTPADIIERARTVFGGRIDLDPASNAAAQQVIKAAAYYTKEDDGLAQRWHGNVWLNPPYSMPLIANFVERVLNAYAMGEIDAAIVLTNNSSDTRWFQALFSAHVACFPSGRLAFWRGAQQSFSARQGQALFYLGSNRPAFIAAFAAIGIIAEAV